MKSLITCFVILLAVASAYAQDREPIIDVHLHAYIGLPPGESAS
ncbi:hypothetical protein [Rhodohalobacter halophilus]|nr:hypothetical protein [Rhodohalobacter halophilus]